MTLPPSVPSAVHMLVLGRLLARLRALRQFSQNDLCAQLDLSQPTLSRIERGKSSVDTHRLMCFATAFSLDVSHVLGLAVDAEKRLCDILDVVLDASISDRWVSITERLPSDAIRGLVIFAVEVTLQTACHPSTAEGIDRF